METNSEPLGVQPVGKLLLKFSIPAIVGVVVNSVYNLVDRFYVGKLGELAMTGIGLNIPFMTLIMAFSFFIGMSAPSMVSIRLGENRKEDAERILGNSFSLLDPIFIFTFDLGISGAALATVISQLVSSAWVIGHFIRGKGALKLRIFIPALVITPCLWGLKGVWLSSPIADLISCTVAGFVLFKELKILGKMESGGAATEGAV